MSKLAILLVFVMLIPLAASQEFVFKQTELVDLKVPCFNNGTLCSSTSSCNVSITSPTGKNITQNLPMQNQVQFHNVTLTRGMNVELGEYTSTVVCADANQNGFSTFNYLVSPSGTDDDSIANIILLSVGFLFSMGIIFLGFQKQDPWFVMFGSLTLFLFGLWILLNGIGNYRNTLTEGTSFIVLGIAGYISIRTGMELMDLL